MACVEGVMVWPDTFPLPRIGEVIWAESDSGMRVKLRVIGVEHSPSLLPDGCFDVKVYIKTKKERVGK